MQVLVHRMWMPEGVPRRAETAPRCDECKSDEHGARARPQRGDRRRPGVAGGGRGIARALHRAPGFLSGQPCGRQPRGRSNRRAAEIAAFRDLLAEFGITLDGVSGADTLAGVLANCSWRISVRRRSPRSSALPRSRPVRHVELSPAARSLVGRLRRRRADLAQRRIAGRPAGAGVHAGASSAGVAIRRPRRTRRPASRRSTIAARCAAAKRCTTWATSS